MPDKSVRDRLLSMNKRRYKKVAVGGEDFWIRNLSEREKSAYEVSLLKNGKTTPTTLDQATRRLICCCLVDKEGGDLVFRPDEQDQLRDLDGGVTAAIYGECLTFCGFKEGDIEGLVKN